MASAMDLEQKSESAQAKYIAEAPSEWTDLLSMNICKCHTPRNAHARVILHDTCTILPDESIAG